MMKFLKFAPKGILLTTLCIIILSGETLAFHMNITAKFTKYRDMNGNNTLSLPKYQILKEIEAEKKEKLLWSNVVYKNKLSSSF